MEIGNVKITVKMALSLACLMLGIVIYLAWGAAYGEWADIGIYSVTIVCIAAGIIGLIIAREEQRA
jgi:lipopolysaccharide export LptBFGC system permease protein LptF